MMANLLGEMRLASADATVPERVRVMLVDAVAEIERLKGIAGDVTDWPGFAGIRDNIRRPTAIDQIESARRDKAS